MYVVLLAVLGTVALIAAGVAYSDPDDVESDAPLPDREPELSMRAFSDDSWWNTPLPDDAPLDPWADDDPRLPTNRTREWPRLPDPRRGR